MIADNLQKVMEQISRAARSASRDPDQVRLVVVSKGHSEEAVMEAVEAGARDLGENYVEEAAGKIQACSGNAGLTWHMIGHVQSRKARPVCELFHWLHSLDSVKLARRLDQFAVETGRVLPVLLECNMSGEETKFGYPAWQEEMWTSLLEEVNQIACLPNLSLRGLMTMAPYAEDPEDARVYFVRLRKLQDYLAQSTPQSNWGELSMGMSADFEVAIQEGATMVRIGTAIMGPRPTH